MAQEIWVLSQVKSYQRFIKKKKKKKKKRYLMPPCLTLSIIKHGSRVKWSNPRKGVAPPPTPWYSSYRKGRLRSPTLLFTYYLPHTQTTEVIHMHLNPFSYAVSLCLSSRISGWCKSQPGFKPSKVCLWMTIYASPPFQGG